MLVLSRKRGEQIVIGEDVVLTVVKILGNRVQLGIQAPRDVSIDRAEVARLVAAELNDEAATVEQ